MNFGLCLVIIRSHIMHTAHTKIKHIADSKQYLKATNSAIFFWTMSEVQFGEYCVTNISQLLDLACGL